jgi:hypothetical protein
MGESKRNPIAQLAKQGKLPPKERKPSKREIERLMYAKTLEIMFKLFEGKSLEAR